MTMMPLAADAARAWLDALPADGLVLLFKHSPACGASVRAEREVGAFAAGDPRTPVHVVDVIARRPLARELAEVLGVRHESPQVVLLRGGRPVWTASHGAVTRSAIEVRVAAERAPAADVRA